MQVSTGTSVQKFQRILAAVDLTKESAQVLSVASSMVKAFHGQLSIVHVIEAVVLGYNDNLLIDLAPLEKRVEENAKAELEKLAQRFEIPTVNQHILLGKPAAEIHALAKELDVDLIVIGTHGKSGLSLLLGSTANSVLHGSQCNVLAVRVYS